MYLKGESCAAKPQKLMLKMYFPFGESMVPLLFIYHQFQLALSGVRDFWLHQEIWHKRHDLFFRAIQETVASVMGSTILFLMFVIS